MVSDTRHEDRNTTAAPIPPPVCQTQGPGCGVGCGGGHSPGIQSKPCCIRAPFHPCQTTACRETIPHMRLLAGNPGTGHRTSGRSSREQKKKCSKTALCKKTACSSYGWWPLAVGGWRLVVIGDWRLVAVGGGWLRLVVGDWWLVGVGGRRLAVGGGWWLVVPGGSL